MRGERVALVTGASSGLGREFAGKIGEMGLADEIWLIARRKENLERLREELPVKARILPLDLLDDDSFAALDKLLHEENPHISLLINNAGRCRAVSFAEEEMEDVRDMVRLDAEVPVKLVRLCLPYMMEGAGMINVCSAASFVPLPGLSVYSASKSFLLSFSRSLYRELKGRGIAVTALCPYWIEDTELMGKAGIATHPLGMLKAKYVAERGLLDNRRGKEMSIPGIMAKLTCLGAALLPLPVLLFFKKLFRA
ncbi:SDR family oxidoreductase [uncultured Dialister sp.]|uniref:SDR family NAD(P)-dependent oxidoreductase n=1 Tax=uncultured Dialister sp. TaxID=278064 RepID=UPI00262E6A8C|nr:SDR family NAD(P)-dependent oxidoreductase [uncultured Dialister sp.]